MPYMLLAFIYNPLQTSVTYLALGVYIFCGYMLCWVTREAILAYKSSLIGQKSETSDETDYAIDNTYDLCTFKGNKISKFIIFLILFLSGQGLLAGVVYFSVVIFYILTLGSFDDFEVIQNLLPPLLIGVLTYFVAKPTFRQAKQKFSFDSDDHIVKLKLLKEEIFKEGMQCEIDHKKINDDPSNTPKTT